MMRDLVPDRISYHLLQFLSRARDSFVRTLIDGDFVGEIESLKNRTVRERTSLI